MNEKILCEICLKRDKIRVCNGKYCCETCYPDIYFFPYAKTTVCLRSGDFQNVSKARLKEMDRRVMLPDKRNDGISDYYVGRYGENGKIADKQPDITP